MNEVPLLEIALAQKGTVCPGVPEEVALDLLRTQLTADIHTRTAHAAVCSEEFCPICRR